jgi:hypothetical protein
MLTWGKGALFKRALGGVTAFAFEKKLFAFTAAKLTYWA